MTPYEPKKPAPRGDDKPVVLVAEGGGVGDDKPMTWLRERAEVLEVAAHDPGFDDALARAEGLSVRSYLKVDAALLDRAPKLRVVGRGGVGLEHIDIPECRRRGVEVVYTPDANTQAVVEHTAAMALWSVRTWHLNELDFTEETWHKQRKDVGLHVSEQQILILGMGRVGRGVARALGRGFGCKILYHDINDVTEAVKWEVESAGVEVQEVDFEELLESTGILSIHVDGREENRNLISHDEIQGGCYTFMINTSRGHVVDPQAVYDAIEDASIWSAALDVYEPEPPGPDSVYAKLLRDWPRQVFLTPHMASRTTVATQNMSWVVRDMMSVLEGRRARHPAP